MVKVKVRCHSCGSSGHVTDIEYLSGKPVETVCPECDGQCWVWADKYEIPTG